MKRVDLENMPTGVCQLVDSRTFFVAELDPFRLFDFIVLTKFIIEALIVPYFCKNASYLKPKFITKPFYDDTT